MDLGPVTEAFADIALEYETSAILRAQAHQDFADQLRGEADE